MQAIFFQTFSFFYIHFKMCILLLLQPQKDTKSPLSYTQQQPSYRPPIRNPFKAPGKEDKDAEWRKMQSGGLKTKDEEARPPAEGHETCQKENGDVAIGEKELDLKSKFSVTFRGKHLPPGMKLKKKVSNEEKNSPKENGVGKLQHKVKHVSDDDQPVPEEAERNLSTSSATGVRADKLSEKALQKDSDLKKPADDKTSIKLSNSTVDKTLGESSFGGLTQASKDSSTSGHTPERPSQSTDSRSHPANKCQSDDDDVVLVSVKPAARKSPATAVQQTLTTFPGFQPASNIKSPDDPRGLRGLFTAQLQQVKVSVKD